VTHLRRVSSTRASNGTDDTAGLDLPEEARSSPSTARFLFIGGGDIFSEKRTGAVRWALESASRRGDRSPSVMAQVGERRSLSLEFADLRRV